jgi:hypothetical protein
VHDWIKEKVIVSKVLEHPIRVQMDAGCAREKKLINHENFES